MDKGEDVMIKVDQNNVNKGNGNCMQAVLASLFEVNLSDAINVMDYPDPGWHIPFMEWVESVGYSYIGVMNSADKKDETYSDLLNLESVRDHFYGVVPSRNFEGVTHAVVINRNGVVVHDPNPDRKWLGVDVVDSGDLIYWYLFEKRKM